VFRKYILPFVVFVFYKTLWATWKIRFNEPPEMLEALANNKGFLLAHWHGDELALMHIGRRYKLATIVSTSKDGEIMNRVLSMMGVPTSRGSSTRGAVGALKGLIGLLKSGYNSSFAVDGPKGPIYKVKPGVFEVSRLLGIPIFAAGVAVDKKKTFEKSWNKTILPLFFAQISIHWIYFPAVGKDDDPRDPELASRLESTLRSARDLAYKEFASQVR
jgi:lysophospholipid acyltransferase (LPLAT)-like uncharacterized protein